MNHPEAIRAGDQQQFDTYSCPLNSVVMSFGYSKLARRIAFEIQFDDDCALVADDPAIVSRLDGDHLRRVELNRATIRVLNVNTAASKKPNVCELAEFMVDHGLDVLRPAEARRVEDTLHTALTDADHVDLHTADIMRLCSGNCTK